MLFSALLLIHLVCFAAYLGAGFAQLTFMKRSETVTGELQKAYEQLSANILVKIELPAIFGSVITGVVFIATNPAYMKQGWLHGKLLCVLILLVLSHLEMFNAKQIGRLREAGKQDEIDARKARHRLFGNVGTLLVVIVLFCVTFLRLGALASH